MPIVTTFTVEEIEALSLLVRRRDITANFTIVTGVFFPCDATSGAIAITLPSAGALSESRVIVVKKTDSSVNAVTVTRAGSDTIDGATTYVLSSQYDAVILVDDESGNWHAIGSI